MENQKKVMMIGANHRGDRRELDYYPTPANVTHALMRFLKVPEAAYIWEPACGERYMSRVIGEYCHVLATDIVEGVDYLTAPANPLVDGIITNPPFNLAEQFIRKATSEAGFCAFLLKSQYWHASKRYRLFQECQPKYILPLTWRPDFLEHERTDGKKGSPTMDVSWCVWEKGYSGPTVYQPLLKP